MAETELPLIRCSVCAALRDFADEAGAIWGKITWKRARGRLLEQARRSNVTPPLAASMVMRLFG
jgi:hypothetical protein